MAGRVIVGLIALGAIIGGLAGDAFLGEGILALVLVILGLAYAGVAIDAEDATGYLVLAIAVAAREWPTCWATFRESASNWMRSSIWPVSHCLPVWLPCSCRGR